MNESQRQIYKPACARMCVYLGRVVDAEDRVTGEVNGLMTA